LGKTIADEVVFGSVKATLIRYVKAGNAEGKGSSSTAEVLLAGWAKTAAGSFLAQDQAVFEVAPPG
jgi:hypothetical protein